MKKHSLSIIIPAYNSEKWISPTIEKIVRAINNAPSLDAEIIIVNDGSTDKTLVSARAIDIPGINLRIIDQVNKGRFLARKAGLDVAKGENILFVDSRVYLHEKSLLFLSKQMINHPKRKVWNGHVEVAKKGNIIARFGDAITYIGWRRYFHKPKLTSYGINDFDYYPKGTGCFFAPKDLLVYATERFIESTHDIRFSSDDTLLIRLIAEKERIHLSPEFSCTYFARTKLKQFIKHSFGRGMFFVDGFLRPGTRFFYPLIFFLTLTILIPIILILIPSLLVIFILTIISLWILELIIALLLGVPVKDAFSLFLLSPLFALAYGLGIWRAVIRRMHIQ